MNNISNEEARRQGAEHDSLFLRFEQLQKILERITRCDNDMAALGALDASALVNLIRAQVLR